MGIGTIMAAKQVLIVVSGEDKAQIVRDAFFGPVTPEVPASILQFHPNAVAIVDEAAILPMKAAVAAIPIAIATTTTSMAKAAAATNSETKEAAPVAASFLG